MEVQMEQEFFFESSGAPLVGRLHVPNDKARGAVVLTGPLTSVKEQASGAYARALAQRGYFALAFDHRYFGESGGEPRQFENPIAKIEDIGAAANALRQDARTKDQQIFAVGVCAGGGYMARAVAKGNGFLAFAGVAGYYGEATPESNAANQARIARGQAAEKWWRESHVAETIPAVAPDNGDVAMPLREAYEFYGTPRGAVPNYVNGYAVQSLAYTVPFDSIGAASEIRVPTLMVHSEHALSPPLARKFYSDLKVVRRELWLESKGQIDFYDDPTLIGTAADAIADWFARAAR
jgi:fermentation-respiration switch protein FrsA (DUF1100 family)